MSGFYDLQGQEINQAQWVRLVRQKKAFVKSTPGIAFDVRTRWTGTDLAGEDDEGRPLIYEVVVFKAKTYTDVEKKLFATREDAVKAHDQMLKDVSAGKYDSDEE